MCRDAAGRKSRQALFRQAAVTAVGHRLFGEVSIVVPPSSRAAILIALLSTAALVATTWIVEVPQRSHAVGVLMPAGGFVDVVAERPGQVAQMLVSQGQLVAEGHLLVTTGGRSAHEGRSVSLEILRSLQTELELLNNAHAHQQEIAADKLTALAEEMAAAIEQIELAEERQRLLDSELEMLEKRLARWRELVQGGHVSRDAFEREQANVSRARADRTEFRRTTVALLQRKKALARISAEARKQLDLDLLQHSMSAERLRREIDRSQFDVLQEFRASEPSVVAQVLVRPGDAIQPGQVLLKLRKPGDRLQAWLYLPTSRARLLRTGQAVEISLDAYPRQVYGTHTAVVSSVSGIALLPQDIHVPLLLAGPVFEVKAELEKAAINTEAGSWPLSPGISFSAEIIQRRLKLYEWLLQAPISNSGGGNG